MGVAAMVVAATVPLVELRKLLDPYEDFIEQTRMLQSLIAISASASL